LTSDGWDWEQFDNFDWKTIADALVTTTVEPLFGAPFTVQGDYEPTLREKLFGQKRKKK
jgi:hypothetical protein